MLASYVLFDASSASGVRTAVVWRLRDPVLAVTAIVQVPATVLFQLTVKFEPIPAPHDGIAVALGRLMVNKKSLHVRLVLGKVFENLSLRVSVNETFESTGLLIIVDNVDFDVESIPESAAKRLESQNQQRVCFMSTTTAAYTRSVASNADVA